MKFLKYHCLGNDYLIFNSAYTESKVPVLQADIVKKICNRNFGLGADGILVGIKEDKEDFFSLHIYNSDGSIAEKSGNGLRIFARSLWDQKIVTNKIFKINTIGGLVKAKINDSGKIVTIEMGEVSFFNYKIPMKGKVREVLNETLEINNEKLKICAANIGNPHCIVLHREVSDTETKRLGPMIEKHPLFPNQTNVQFLEVINRNKIRIEIWERGAGYTLASGSSSCAAASIAHKLGWCDEEIEVLMPGGKIDIEIGKNYNVTMKGPVTRIGKMTLDMECIEYDSPKC
tara:strand:- start:2057 stop:2920 length:864 start_codon:yes stop_codon:yes gene_type:complete